MSVRILQYSDVENAPDDPERIGRLAGLLRERRGGSTLVCGTGDTLAPGLLSMETAGDHALPFFEAVGTDFATFGNHDFDVGLDPLRSVVDRAPQTWLATNLSRATGGEPFAAEAGTQRLATETVAGETVGLLGVTDPDTVESHPATEGLRVLDPVAAARDGATTLRERGADYVVVLSHAGTADDDIAAIEAVDLVLGGHLHDVRSDAVEGTPVVHPGQRGELVAEVEWTGASIDVALHDVTEAPLEERVAGTYRDRYAAQGLDETVGTVAPPLERGQGALYPESAVGNLVVDAYRWVADADVALCNALMLRSGSPLSRDVSVGDLKSLTPFDNDVYTTRLDGEELRALLGNLGGPGSAELEVFAHVSGARLTWRRTDTELSLVEATVGGEVPDPATTYTVAAPAYAFFSGLFPPLAPERRNGEHGHQHDALVGYVRKHGMDTDTDGRMTAVEDTADDVRSLR